MTRVKEWRTLPTCCRYFVNSFYIEVLPRGFVNCFIHEVHRLLPVSGPICTRAHNARRALTSRAQHRPAILGPRSFREGATAMANPRFLQFYPWIA